jgi:hypothetical protein
MTDWREDITPEEARQKLKDMGIPVDEWEGDAQSDKDAPGFTLPTFKQIAESAQVLADMLEKRIGEDKALIAALKEKEARLLHGGGR